MIQCLGFTPAPSKEKMTRMLLFLYQCHNMILDNCSAVSPHFRRDYIAQNTELGVGGLVPDFLGDRGPELGSQTCSAPDSSADLPVARSSWLRIFSTAAELEDSGVDNSRCHGSLEEDEVCLTCAPWRLSLWTLCTRGKTQKPELRMGEGEYQLMSTRGQHRPAVRSIASGSWPLT